MKKNNFLKGAVILGAAGIIVKIMGAFFRIPLGRIIGSEGMGYYQAGYTVFNLILAFTASGFPTAISKLVSEKRARKDYMGAHKVFKTSFYLLFILGTLGSVTLALMTSYLANDVFKSPNSYYAVLALAPAVFFVAVLASYRGYFQGMNDMTPTAISQLVEQAARVVMGLSLAILLLRKFDISYGAAGASFGAAVGAGFALLAMIFIYYRRKDDILLQNGESQDSVKEGSLEISKNLLRISIPIAIGAAVMPLINMVDTVVVMGRLQEIGFTVQESTSLYGQLQGMAATLVNLPQVLTVALATSIVPVISESIAVNDWESVEVDIKSVLKVALLIGLPASIGLAVLSNPIMLMLFPKEPASAGRVLLFLALSVTFLAPLQTLTGVLQGLGKPDLPVKNLIIGGVFKFIATYILTGIPGLNIAGAAIGTVIAYFIALLLNFLAVKKETKFVFPAQQFLIKPLLSVGIMGLIVYITYGQAASLLSNTKATVVSIGVGGLVYALMLLKTQTIVKEDFDLLPGANKIVNILYKLRLMKD